MIFHSLAKAIDETKPKYNMALQVHGKIITNLFKLSKQFRTMNLDKSSK